MFVARVHSYHAQGDWGMYKLMIIAIFCLMSMVLMACDYGGPPTEEVNAHSMGIEQADVYDTTGMGNKVGTLYVEENVLVVERTKCRLVNACFRESAEVSGWISCEQLDFDNGP